jgi:hypothetical protein
MPPLLQHSRPVIAEQVEAAPSVDWLIDGHFVATIDQLACNAAQEMGIAVIPARRERMTE